MKNKASLFGSLGLVAIAFALLSFLMALFGVVPDLYWAAINLAVGVVLFLLGVVGGVDTIRARLRSGETKRIGKYGTSAIASTVLLLVLLGMLAFLSTRYHKRFDASQAKIHSLSEQTRKVLDALAQAGTPAKAIAFYRADDGQVVRDLLEQYKYVNSKFEYLFADPLARVDLVEKYQVSSADLERGAVVLEVGNENGIVSGDITEERITNGLLRITRRQTKTVYFLEGHNEGRTHGEQAKEPSGYEQAVRLLVAENYKIEILLLSMAGQVPDDADVVIIAGPTRPFEASEHVALQKYLARGGALMVMIDPRANTDLYADLLGWGVEVGDDVVIDELQGLFGRAASPFAGAYDSKHPITKDLREVTLFHFARSVRARQDVKSDFSTLAMTSAKSWAETDVEELFKNPKAVEFGSKDKKGPVPLVVAGTPTLSAQYPLAEGAVPRMVVIGDSDFASNQAIHLYSNRDFFLNSVSWLLGDTEALSIRPALSPASRLSMTQQQLNRLRYLALLLLPEIIALLGVVTWWSRRQGGR